MSRRTRRREATATVVSLASVCAASASIHPLAPNAQQIPHHAMNPTTYPTIDAATPRNRNPSSTPPPMSSPRRPSPFRRLAATSTNGAKTLVAIPHQKTNPLPSRAPLVVACDAAMEDGREDAFEEMARQARRIVVDGDVRTPREVGARAAAFGACLGAWFGALPIPLDWDRPWQKWPVSVVRGMTFGHLVGATSAIVYVYLHDVLRMRATATQTRGGEQTLTAAAEGEKEMFPSSPPKKRRGRPRKNPA